MGICVCVPCFFLEVPLVDMLNVMVASPRVIDELLLPVYEHINFRGLFTVYLLK